MKTPGRQRSGYHHGDLRAALIRSALEIVDEQGIGALTLRKAARHAGVSHAAPAHHFKDMKGLMATVAVEGFRKMAAKMAAAEKTAANDDPLLRFKAIGGAYIEFALTHVAYFKVMFHPAVADKNDYPDLRAASEHTLDMLVTALKACQRAQLIAKGDILTQALFAWSAVHGLSTLAADYQLEGKGLSAEPAELAEMLTAYVYCGLRPV